MNQPDNSVKSDMTEALKSKFYLASVVIFWVLTGFAFIYAITNSQQEKVQILNEFSSEAPE